MSGLRLSKIPLRLVLLGLIGVALLLTGNMLGSPKPQQSAVTPPQTSVMSAGSEASLLRSYQNALAFEAERVISQIRGAGKVVVSVTTSGGPEAVIATNRTETLRKTEEMDGAGVSRTIEERNDSTQPVIARQSSSGDSPVVIRVAAPTVEGVVVVAQGAGDAHVRAQIFEAVQVLFDVPAHRVHVLAMKVGD